MQRRRLIPCLFLLSGATALVYEIIWIRLFGISFGNTQLAMSTVLSVFLGGLALGSALAAKLTGRESSRLLQLYGWAELATGLYALLIPRLIVLTHPVLEWLYGSGRDQTESIALALVLVRAALGSAILLPATMMMGASLPLLAGWLKARGSDAAAEETGTLYGLNLAGAVAGALATGFVLLPGIGFTHALGLASAINAAIGIAALWASQQAVGGMMEVASERDSAALPRRLLLVAFVSGASCMLYEVVWGRVFGLLLGPTTSTVTLTLATFLLGLTIAALLVRRIGRNLEAWLCASQFGAVVLLAGAAAITGVSPQWVSDWVRLHSGAPLEIEVMKLILLGAALLPLAVALGMALPLTLRLVAGQDFARQVGGLYTTNTIGCIVGSLAAGWLLIPLIGTERSLLAGLLLNLALAIYLLHTVRRIWMFPALGLATAFVALAIFLPRWNMAELTAGAYKYAPYLQGKTTAQSLKQGEVLFLKEGSAGTVAVRKEDGATVLSIEGKVDASNAGSDLLAEKLLAHLPLLLAGAPRKVCLIGLASGVTAGAILTHPVEKLDVVELSRDVRDASHLFDRVNRRPLEDPRTALLLNDGRNHLELTSTRYDAIISEPSNPWIAGMNSLFTREFFALAKSRLTSDGVFAQWFHIDNMPQDDLKSLVRSFTQVFPSAMLWQLNDGDVLLTGFAREIAKEDFSNASRAAREDLASVAVRDPRLLLSLYWIGGEELRNFAGEVPPNTDDDPRLEFHGQRDLHAQTDAVNAEKLFAVAERSAPPESVRNLRESLSAEELVSMGHMFERAESRSSAFRNYRRAWERQTDNLSAIAGMDRCARLSEEHAVVARALQLPSSSETLEKRTEAALDKARIGDAGGARSLFEETIAAQPRDAAPRFHYGLFCLERKEYRCAATQLKRAVALNPNHVITRRTLRAIERSGRRERSEADLTDERN